MHYLICISGTVAYWVDVAGSLPTITYKVEVIDKNKKVVATNNGANGEIKIANANLWWPYLMDDNPGYLYTLRV